MIKKTLIFFIRLYQLFVSPLLGSRCRFYPSCSEYSLRSIEKYGVFSGSIKSVKRILKCHPWNPGGVDMP